jgi:putative DNA primase/helicase
MTDAILELAALRQRKAEGGATEDALATEFTRRHGDTLLYVATWGRWLTWAGERWQHEDTLLAFDLARQIVRDTPGARKDARTVAAMERLARADRRHAATVSQWDSDPDLITLPGDD